MTKQIQMTDEAYYAIDRLSFSSCKSLVKSPRQYSHEKKNPFTGSKFTRFGTIVHMWLNGEQHKIIFEPDLSEVKTKSGTVAKSPRSTSEGKAIIKSCQDNLPEGYLLVPYDSKEMLDEIKVQFDANPEIQELLSRVSTVEAAYLYVVYELPWKGKLDFEGPDFIIDLKTTNKGIEWSAFKRTIDIMNYDLQAALYLTAKASFLGVSVFDIKYHMIAIESQAPFDVAPYTLSEDTIYSGLRKMRLVCDRYKEHVKESKPFYRGFQII